MRQDFTRFVPVLLQIGSPLKVNVYELDAAGNARIVWARGHVFMPLDLTEVLNPMRRLLVLKYESEAAVKEIESTPLETTEEREELPYWCG